MKLHAMTLCAFGPFPGTETVDFDQLSAEGLFLLRGRTGSGKTSVLDAVTFALYGNVAGLRDHNLLKSHHAPDERAPFVELEFSVGGHRYWVRRTPSFIRAGRKTMVNPTLSLKRWTGDGWDVGVSGIKAATAELSGILQLSLKQFTKVILLPQGDFADFLHAKSADKQALLEQLFDTFRFRRLEERLNEQAKEARARSERIEAQIEQLTARLRSDAASLLMPPAEEGAGTEEADLDDVPPEQLGERVTVRAEERRGRLTGRLEAAREAADKARALAEELSARRRELRRWAEHQDARRTYAAASDQADEDRARCARHEQARTVEKWFREATRAQERHQQAAYQAKAAAQKASDTFSAGWSGAVDSDADAPAVVDLGGTPDHSALQQAAETLTGLRTRLAEEEAEELEARHSHQLRSAEQSALTAAQAQQSAEELTANVDQLTKSRQELAERRQDEAALDAAAESARERVTDADSIVQLMARRDRAAEQQERRQAEAERAHEQYRAQDDDYQRAVRAYRGGMAAQLAGRLEPGEPCMVCGSVEHPAPHAADEEEGATLEQVDEAQQRMTAAHQKAVAAAAAHRTAQQQYDELLEELGGEAEDSDAHTSAEEAAQRLESAHQELSRAQEARREQQRIARELERSAEELHAAQRRLTSLEHERQSAQAEAERARTAAAELEDRLARLRGGHPSVSARLEAVKELQAAVQQAVDAVSAESAAASAASTAAQSAERELAESDFADSTDLRRAQLPEEELTRLRGAVKEHDAQGQRLDYEAEQPEVKGGQARQSAGEQAPDADELQQVQQAAVHAEDRLEQARDALTTFDARRESVTGCIASLNESLQAKADQAEEQTRLLALAETLNGRGHDNPMRMTLTTFVLAAKLEEVAQAASRHLGAMSEGRYQLLHQDTGSGGSKQGLDLQVHDEHSDERRPASSLSGGETFMASLAMALGLAEVVQAEAGGVEMESLFIDEGFGSLDEQTLDAVMVALTSLQGEGRRVGVVSHVAEMHTQIPSQLIVRASRVGSTLTMRVPG